MHPLAGTGTSDHEGGHPPAASLCRSCFLLKHSSVPLQQAAELQGLQVGPGQQGEWEHWIAEQDAGPRWGERLWQARVCSASPLMAHESDAETGEQVPDEAPSQGPQTLLTAPQLASLVV